MGRFIIRRLAYGILVLFGVTVLVFVLFHILPGDPARMMMGQRTDLSSIEAVKKDLGLDKPLYIQFLVFLNDVSPVSVYQGKDKDKAFFMDKQKHAGALRLFGTGGGASLYLKKPWLGRSYQSQRKVSSLIRIAFPKTFLLASVSIGFALVLGICIGVLCAIRKNRVFDQLAQVFSVLGMSLPSFFAAILIAWVFAYLLGEYTGLNMVGSLYSVDDFGEGSYPDLKNLVLPAITLGIRPLAIVVQLSRSSMLDVLSQDYIRTAKAKGLGRWRIITKHALRNAMNPVVTAISGWFASLLAGAVFVEYVFDWKGIGVLIVNALETFDFPVLMGCVLFISVILVIINILVDLIYGLLDPRIRY